MAGVSIDTGSGSEISASDLIALAKNPALYEAKLQALKDQQAELDKRIALAGVADEIMALRDQARADTASAGVALAKANADAEAKITEANAEADRIVFEAQGKALVLNAAATSARNSADEALAEAEATNRAAVEREAAASARERLAAQAIADADAAKAEAGRVAAEFQARLDRLNAAARG